MARDREWDKERKREIREERERKGNKEIQRERMKKKRSLKNVASNLIWVFTKDNINMSDKTYKLCLNL